MNENSNKVVTNEGNILKDISDKKEIPCPTCKGKGTLPDPNMKTGFYTYKHPPRVDCRTCDGEGWVIVSNTPST